MKKSEIEWFVYEPLDWQKLAGDQVQEGNCRCAVPFSSFRARQCRKKAAVNLYGYGFCKLHAKMIEGRLERGYAVISLMETSNASETSRLKLFEELEIGGIFWWHGRRWKKVAAAEDLVGRYNAETLDGRHRWYFAWWGYVTVSSAGTEADES